MPAFEEIINLIKSEVKPALGCTEPAAVALAAAKSCEILRSTGEEIIKVDVAVSANILKNGMGVGIPGTGMCGLPIAVALAVVCGDSSLGLEVLSRQNEEFVSKAKELLSTGMVNIRLADNSELLYASVSASSANHIAEAVVSGCHDTITLCMLDGVELYRKGSSESNDSSEAEATPTNPAKTLTVKQIWEFATTVPLSDIEFLMESVKMNKALSDEGLSHNYGLQAGKTIMNNADIYGDSVLSYAMACTAAASDARMAGCKLPAMSNSGSGNQGITVTVPVISYAEKAGAGHEHLLRAITIAHLVAIHIKGYLGKLSALCGCVVASTGASCGIAYLKGGDYETICRAIKNMLANISGMFCDGAKCGCALKVASGVSCAIQSAVLASSGISASSNDGIIDDDVEKTISNIGSIGSTGMKPVDRMILDIMSSKR